MIIHGRYHTTCNTLYYVQDYQHISRKACIYISLEHTIVFVYYICLWFFLTRPWKFRSNSRNYRSFTRNYPIQHPGEIYIQRHTLAVIVMIPHEASQQSAWVCLSGAVNYMGGKTNGFAPQMGNGSKSSNETTAFLHMDSYGFRAELRVGLLRDTHMA